jgi:peptidoglycan/xylan/chitin deacetylase (PgdA/CDA1 family)
MNVIQEISKELFGDNCIQFVFWDVDSVDWVPAMTPTDIFTTLKAHYTGGRYYDFKLVNGKYVKVPLNMVNPPKGGVVLQHDIHDRTLEAVRMFIKYAKAQGLQLVTLPETEEFTVLRECRFIVDR